MAGNRVITRLGNSLIRTSHQVRQDMQQSFSSLSSISSSNLSSKSFSTSTHSSTHSALIPYSTSSLTLSISAQNLAQGSALTSLNNTQNRHSQGSTDNDSKNHKSKNKESTDDESNDQRATDDRSSDWEIPGADDADGDDEYIRQEKQKYEESSKDTTHNGKAALLYVSHLEEDELDLLLKDLITNIGKFFLDKETQIKIITEENISAIKEKLLKLNIQDLTIEDIIIKILEILLPKRQEPLKEDHLAIRQSIAAATAEHLNKDQNSTYIYLVALINKHLLNNNYPIPREAGEKILENIRQADRGETSDATSHFNEIPIFAKVALTQAVNKRVIDKPAILGCVLNLVGGMVVGAGEHAAYKRGALNPLYRRDESRTPIKRDPLHLLISLSSTQQPHKKYTEPHSIAHVNSHLTAYHQNNTAEIVKVADKLNSFKIMSDAVSNHADHHKKLAPSASPPKR